jgi:hemerythrin-like domain-containing protein
MATTMERDSQGRFKGKAEGNGRKLGALGAAAAGGAALGLLAMFGRKAAVQAPSALAGDWVEALELEHKAVMKIFDTLENTDETATTRRNLHLAQLKHALAKHDVEEGNVIYPALREAGFTEQADQLTKEHGYVKQYLYELETMPTSSPDWIAKLRTFRADLERHVAEEENVLFPQLRELLSEEKNKKLTATMNKEGFKVA